MAGPKHTLAGYGHERLGNGHARFEQPGLSAPVVVAKENLQQAIDAVEAALQQGATTASLNGASIPVSLSLLERMQEFQPESPDPDPAPTPDPEPDPDPEPQADGPYVVETIDNFEAINFVRSAEQREPQLGFVQPRTLVPATAYGAPDPGSALAYRVL